MSTPDEPNSGDRVEPAFGSPAPAPTAPAFARAPAWDSSLDELARDLLRERRADRRWRIFFRLAWLLLVLVVITLLFSSPVGQASSPS